MDQAEPTQATRHRSTWIIGLIQLVFVIAVIGAAIGLSQALKNSVNGNAPQIADLRGAAEITVRVAQPEVLQFTPEIRVNGTVQASAEVSVSPQVSGEIRKVSSAFRAGSEVKKGTLLFEIDRSDYVLAVQRAESEVASARSDLQQLEAEAAIAVKEWEELYPGRAVNELAARIPQIEAAKARLASATANKQTAELSLRRTRVTAPADARVLRSSLDIGQIVSPGQTVGSLVALDSIELAVPISASQLSILDPAQGRMAEFQTRGAPSELRSAQITRIDASLDARTRLSNLYLEPEDRERLRIGDFVDVTIKSDTIEGAIALPASALSGQASVWVIEQGALSLRTIIVLGEREAGDIVVAAPFETAEGVVALPPLEASEGQKVSIREQDGVVVANGGRSDASE